MIYSIFVNGKNAGVKGADGQLQQAVFNSENEAIQALAEATARDFKIHIKHAENRVRKYIREGHISIMPCVIISADQYIQDEKFINHVITLITQGKLIAAGGPSFGDWIDIIDIPGKTKPQRDPKPAVGPLGNAAFPKTTQLKSVRTQVRKPIECNCPTCRSKRNEDL